MSEYITIETELTDRPNVVIIHTNLNLAPDGPEIYLDLAAGEEGSPLAQTLFIIDGILALTIDSNDLIITHEPDLALYVLVDEVDAALKDFFL